MRITSKRCVATALCLTLYAATATNAGASRIRLYENEHFEGAGQFYFTAKQSLADQGTDTFASAKVISGRWLLCERPLYAGDCAWISRDVPSLSDIGYPGSVGSLRPERVPVLRRDWGDRSPPSTALVFFAEAKFQGDWFALHESVPDLDDAAIPVKPASIVVRNGVWRLCTQTGFRGSCLSLTASAWDLGAIFTTEIKSAERLH